MVNGTDILRLQKFVVDVLGFQIELCCRYFGLFWLGNFLKNLAIFFSNHLVTLQLAYPPESCQLMFTTGYTGFLNIGFRLVETIKIRFLYKVNKAQS